MYKRGLSVFDLKCIAVFSMLVDHIGMVLFPSELWLRYVGRLAFPIYAFLIAEGFFHTRNVKKYIGRLFVFALISEIPYDLARHNTLFYKDSQNIFFTLALALVCIYVLDACGEQLLIACAVLASIGLAVYYWIKPDYGIGGIGMILCFYLFRMYKAELCLSVTAINFFCYEDVQRAGALALFPILLYNGKKGPSAKYFFYLFYPVHLLILYLIRRCVIHVA